MRLLGRMIEAYTQCEPKIKQIIEDCCEMYLEDNSNKEDKDVLFCGIVEGLSPFLSSKEMSELFHEE